MHGFSIYNLSTLDRISGSVNRDSKCQRSARAQYAQNFLECFLIIRNMLKDFCAVT